MATERTVLVRLKADTNDFVRGFSTATAAVNTLRKDIDTTNDRTAWLAQSLLALGPAVVPLAAGAVPALSGLVTQMGLLVGATGTAVLAFQGVGDGLKALNDYQLEPSAENFAKLREAMEDLGPEGAHFVQFLDDIAPQFSRLQDIARAGLFPGVEDGIENFLDLMPRLRRIVSDIAEAMGQLTSEAGAGIAGPGFRDFFRYLEDEAKPLLLDMGHAVGNFAQGFANMVVAFGPMTSDFSDGLLGVSEAFNEWSQGLDSNESFQGFLDYVNEVTPRVLDVLGALAGAMVSVVQAMAPVGEVTLALLEPLLDIIAAVAATPLGSIFFGIAAAMSAYGRAVALASVTTGGLAKAFAGTFDVRALATTTSAITSAERATAGLAAAQRDAALAHSRYIGALKASSFAGEVLPGRPPTANMVQVTDDLVGANQRLAVASRRAEDAEARKAAAMRESRNATLKTGAMVGALALATSGVADEIGLSNTAMGVGVGMMAGPFGAAIGGTIGAMMDMAAANDDVTTSLDNFHDALGNATSSADLPALRAQLEETQGTFDDFKQGMDDATNQFGISLSGLAHPQDAFGAYKDRVEGIFGESDVEELQTRLDDARHALERFEGYARAVDEINLNVELYGDTQKGQVNNLQAALHNINDDLITTTESADALATALDAIFGPKIGLSAAEDAVQKGLNDLNDALKEIRKNAKGPIVLTGDSKAADSNASIAARDLVRTQVSNIQALLNAQAEAGAGSDDLVRTLRDQRRALIDAGKAAGLSKDDLHAYLRELGLTPKLVRTLVEVNVHTAMQALAQARRELESLTSQQWTAILNVRRTYDVVGNAGDAVPDRTAPNAAGGMYGDLPNSHRPMVSTVGLTRVWAEPETGGESYIPHANDWRRPRAKSILEQTAALFGGAVQWNAAGSFSSASSTGGAGGATSVHVIERLADRLTLIVDGQPMTAFVDRRVDAKQTYRAGTGPRRGGVDRD